MTDPCHSIFAIKTQFELTPTTKQNNMPLIINVIIFRICDTINIKLKIESEIVSFNIV